MLLSEAIRLGSLLGPQTFGLMFGSDGASCALGSALLAVGMTEREKQLPYQTIFTKFPGIPADLTLCIELLNERLTREQIADYLVASRLDCESAASAVTLPVQSLPGEDPEAHCTCHECESIRAELASQ